MPGRAAETGVVRVRLYRFDPSIDAAPRYESYEVPSVPRMRIMDVLDYIHEELEVDIGYRWLCGTRKCGTCAVNVNGSPKLACWDEAEGDMTIEPLANMEVIRDLVTSRDGFEASLADISPMLVRKEEYRGFPEPLTSTQFAPMEHLRDCLQCLACQSVCPVVAQEGSTFAGPALLVALSELAQDPRDGADRAHIAADVAHVFDCVSCYECERACPAEIPIVAEAIEPLKRIAYRAGEGEGAQHAKAFLDVVKTRGYLNPTVLALKTKGVNAGTLRMAMRMIPRGKVDLGKALLERKPPGAEGIAKTYGSAEESP